LATERPVKVAIIGGGCAAMAAAFELSRPEHKGKYEITIYQLGWRLGGKGASGRGPADRIEEHGFHVWFGFYENAFRLIRECYAELGRDPRKCRIADWQDAFSPAPFIGLAKPVAKDSYASLISYFPPAEGMPGDPLTEDDPFTVTSYLKHAANALRTMLLTAIGHDTTDSLNRERVDLNSGEQTSGAGLYGNGFDRLSQLVKLGILTTAASLIEAIGILQAILAARLPSAAEALAQFVEVIASSARRQADAVAASDPQLDLLWQAIDLCVTSMLGIVRFGLMSDPRGFDAINEYDFREWLKINGASERALDSILLRGAYDLAFACENGDYERPRHAAGVGLRGAMRMLFGYRGSIVWKMNAGMGDVVFAPFYQVLKRRGVAFQFFHRLERVRLADASSLAPGERSYVEALEFDVQAQVVNGGEYEPLFEVDGLPCWPSGPIYSQIRDGAWFEHEKWKFESHWDRRKVGTKTLRVIEDFDFVILGIGVGAIPYVCQDLIECDQRWRDMVDHVKSVETQAFQIWLKDDLEALGWNHPPVSLSGFVQPFESFADMRQVIGAENWPTRPGAVVYFCSTLKEVGSLPSISDLTYPIKRRTEVHRNAVRFLKHEIQKLWPGAVASNGEFRWQLLMDPAESSSESLGESRFDSQFWIANIDPTERYVISLPGSQRHRISPLDNTYDNLTIAGDWTACGLDTGCVEAAIISGRLAANAIARTPSLESIVGYDHP